MSVKPRVAIASNDECLTRGPNVRFDVSNDGLIPRRLVLELFIVCIGFSFLRFGFGFSGVFVVRADEKLTAFIELEAAIRISKSTITSQGGFGGQGVSVDLA